MLASRRQSALVSAYACASICVCVCDCIWNRFHFRGIRAKDIASNGGNSKTQFQKSLWHLYIISQRRQFCNFWQVIKSAWQLQQQSDDSSRSSSSSESSGTPPDNDFDAGLRVHPNRITPPQPADIKFKAVVISTSQDSIQTLAEHAQQNTKRSQEITAIETAKRYKKDKLKDTPEFS